MARVFIGIGANEGDRLENISRAIEQLGTLSGTAIIRTAAIIETEPLGPPQGRYLNTVVEASTSWAPYELLGHLKAVERRLGRTPSPQRWSARPIDLDLLLYDDRFIDEPELCVPHPRLHERAFVLEPLAQLAPDVIHPVLRQSIAALRDQLTAVKP